MKILEEYLKTSVEQDNEDEGGSYTTWALPGVYTTWAEASKASEIVAGALCKKFPDFAEAKFYVRLKDVKREYEEPGQVRYRMKTRQWESPMKKAKKDGDEDSDESD